MMRKPLKLLKWTAIVLFGTPVLLYLVWLAGNLVDDELSPEVTRLLQQRPTQLSERDNAYFDTIGLNAPPDMDPHAWGVDWFKQASAIDRAVLEDKPAAPIKLASAPGSRQAVLPCSQQDAGFTCLEEVAQHHDTAQQHLARESTLLQRFDALLDKDYQEPYREVSFKSEVPPRASESRAIRLAQVRFALEVAQGRDDDALRKWQRETAFILRQARNSHTLIDAMVFTAALNRYQKLLANYIALHPRAARRKARQLLAMLEPFDKTAMTLRPAIESEAAYSARSMLLPQFSLAATSDEEITPVAKALRWLAAPLFDRPATANELAAQNLEYARISTLEGDAYRNALAKMAAQQNQLAEKIVQFHFHNPVGQIILAVGSPDYSRYLYRSDDILANKKLISFSVELLSRNATASKRIVQEINARQADLRHPYTGELPNWDATKRTLGYSMREQDQGPNYAPLVIKL